MIDTPGLPHEFRLNTESTAPQTAIVVPTPVDLVPEFQNARMQIARPPHFAEREELDAALVAGTRDALLLFIERHPQSRYRPEAEKALQGHGSPQPTR